jgi:hypothetical protein
MAWRVSWAALWATLMLEKPTMKIMPSPKNRHTRPEMMRVETPIEAVEIVVVVMSPSVETVQLRYPAGLLT